MYYPLTVLLGFLAITVGSVTAQESLEREPFDDFYCQTCHGIDGVGNFGVQAPRLAGMEDWYLERQLKLFRAKLRGSHPADIEGVAMQPMALKLTDASIAELVEWVGTWKYIPAPVTLDGDAARGQTLYTVCATCHGDMAQGDQTAGGPQLAGQNDWYLLTQLKNFKAGYRGSEAADSYGNQMRLMAQSLPDEQAMLDVIAYINTLGR